MCSCKVNGILPQINRTQKPITRGLDYTVETLKDAVVSNPDEAYVVKYIPRIIKNVDEFIKSSGKTVTPEDREDMIQEAILASLEKTKVPNYSQLANRSAAHNSAECSRLKQVQKNMEKQNPITVLPKVPSTCTMEESIAQVNGRESVKKVIDDVLETLPMREEAIIRARFGLDGDEPCTLQQLSQQYGTTSEAIRNLENKGLTRLRHPSRTGILKREIFVAPNGALYSLKTSEKSAET